jgi:hypothetical protein
VVGIIALFVVAGLAAILFGLLGLGSVAATLALGSFVAATVAAFSFALVAVFVADVVAGVALGRAVLRGPETTSRPQGLLALAVGAAVLVVLSAVPLLGGIVKLLVVLAGLGALVLVARGRGAAPEPPGGLPA